MREVGVRELKARVSEIVREVERGARYTVTHRGRPVCLLVPVADPAHEPIDEDALWERLHELGAQMAKSWPPGLSAGDLLSEMRR